MAIEVVPYGPLAEDQLRDAEERLGFTLPPSYRRWLAETNGGTPADVAVLPYDDTPATDFLWEHRAFGLRSDDPFEDIVYNYTSFDDRFTDAYLPAASVSGGLLAVKVKGDDCGSVWFWDDDDPRASDDDNPENIEQLLYRIADDWDQFLDKLRHEASPFEGMSREQIEQHLRTGNPASGTGSPPELE